MPPLSASISVDGPLIASIRLCLVPTPTDRAVYRKEYYKIRALRSSDSDAYRQNRKGADPYATRYDQLISENPCPIFDAQFVSAFDFVFTVRSYLFPTVIVRGV